MPIEVSRLIVKSTLLEPEPEQHQLQALQAEVIRQLKEDILQECQRLVEQARFEQRPR
ncbi:hypothetical protein MN202_03290 [Rheinheimera muenzenbergensis]|uniref:Uncharacterized protein n=1 Tax=Rheinheimera muenzenbergensis TaxID=1193628 RepID=A0ABU8C363_9GAMM|nr:hypothetical protein [Gammaproteobacteria bacterium]MBU1554904.1 hypothetical protein [Gammaproteobacteria bacterium]MBU2071891.1 hypothetical protein [Gammaproteobacteria bacterium]MBU2181752.1 hypothetical protein [Gammaproteobacteria bacterium]MBU2206340.1 hypothetical protein [Gammaproteobacteria bacterium]